VRVRVRVVWVRVSEQEVAIAMSLGNFSEEADTGLKRRWRWEEDS
jgi:hypothetical protein